MSNPNDLPLRPKKPLSAYNFFFKAERARILGIENESQTSNRNKRKHRKTEGMIGFQGLANQVGEKWRNMSDEEKAEYKEKYAADRERYLNELKEWNKQKKVHILAMAKLGKSESEIKDEKNVYLHEENTSDLKQSLAQNKAPGSTTTVLRAALDIIDGKNCDDLNYTNDTSSLNCYLQQNSRVFGPLLVFNEFLQKKDSDLGRNRNFDQVLNLLNEPICKQREVRNVPMKRPSMRSKSDLSFRGFMKSQSTLPEKSFSVSGHGTIYNEMERALLQEIDPLNINISKFSFATQMHLEKEIANLLGEDLIRDMRYIS